MIDIHPELLKLLTPENIKNLEALPEESKQLDAVTPKLLEALETAYTLAANDQQLPKTLLADLILGAYELVRENIQFRNLIDEQRSQIVQAQIVSSVKELRIHSPFIDNYRRQV
jgi:hypothetical protein